MVKQSDGGGGQRKQQGAAASSSGGGKSSGVGKTDKGPGNHESIMKPRTTDGVSQEDLDKWAKAGLCLRCGKDHEYYRCCKWRAELIAQGWKIPAGQPADKGADGRPRLNFDEDRLQLPDVCEGKSVALLLDGGSQAAVMDGGASLHIQGSERPTPGLSIKTAKEGQDLHMECRGDALIVIKDKNGVELPMKLSHVYVAPDCAAILISERQLHTRGGGVHKTRVVPLTCVAGGYRLMMRPWTEADDKRAEEMAASVTVGDAMVTS
ncbi:unnamed protein product [Vitrella brassicaformis CCMP3155]|uniref:Uncharacterized protein n=1 Tax=Vitrella brassicaformis (strain CCMP3155) TaxID=1169540 RepID=A0A0G4ELL3_VITBC|nr:unnamed protein product [Vitrella brassicaformis CCMP3155]|eukprot:CEL97904.1 unnamed protein product [Vitrella brassicaformis CCMP3155]